MMKAPVCLWKGTTPRSPDRAGGIPTQCDGQLQWPEQRRGHQFQKPRTNLPKCSAKVILTARNAFAPYLTISASVGLITKRGALNVPSSKDTRCAASWVIAADDYSVRREEVGHRMALSQELGVTDDCDLPRAHELAQPSVEPEGARRLRNHDAASTQHG